MDHPELRYLTLRRPLAVLDLETTGVDTGRHRVVEVAAVKLTPGGPAAVFHTRVYPGGPIPAAATAVHGLADADVAAAPPFAAVAPALAAFLAGCDLAGFGLAAFDCRSWPPSSAGPASRSGSPAGGSSTPSPCTAATSPATWPTP